MSRDDADDKTVYRVVKNHEEQYSIWPADRDLPAGWLADGKEGLKADCLAHIKEVWTDMRPLSLRKQMDGVSLESDVCSRRCVRPGVGLRSRGAPARRGRETAAIAGKGGCERRRR